MIEELGSPYVKAVNVVEPIMPAIDTLQDRLIHIHLSDNDGLKWAHLTPGEAIIDFPAIVGKLQDIGFAGFSMIETTDCQNPNGAIVESKERSMNWDG